MSDTPSQTERDGSLILATPVTLPDVLDVLIVGGGPYGTATAFRAKELGLNALVNDYDDLSIDEVEKKVRGLSRQEIQNVRDYEKRHKNRKTLIKSLDRSL